jgi:urease accessory protein
MPNRRTRSTIVVLGALTCAVASPAALAHVGTGLAHAHDGSLLDSLASGGLHPLTGIDHLAAMVSVGLWSALNASAVATPGRMPRAMLAAPMAFAIALLCGALLAMAGWTLPGIEPMVAASLLVLGLMVSTRWHLPTRTGSAVIALFALFHGMAHGQDLQGHAAAWLTGMVATTALLHALGLGLGWAWRRGDATSQRWMPRLAGGSVALLGMGLLTPALTTILP